MISFKQAKDMFRLQRESKRVKKELKNIHVEAEAQGVKVEQISSDQGFWIGENDQQRVFVHVSGDAVGKGALAPAALQEGQLVNVSGRFQTIPDDVTTLGLTDVNDLTQLVAQSELIEANSVRTPQ